MRTIARFIFSFLFATVLVCIANFLLQIALIFLDVVTRLESTSAMIIVLWIVTGVFAVVFATGIAVQLTGTEKGIYEPVCNIIISISVIAVISAIVIMSKGHFKLNPSDFSLLLSNGYVFIAYFTGTALMALVMRKLEK